VWRHINFFIFRQRPFAGAAMRWMIAAASRGRDVAGAVIKMGFASSSRASSQSIEDLARFPMHRHEIPYHPPFTYTVQSPCWCIARSPG